MESNDATPMRTSGICACTPGTMVARKFVRRLLMMGSMLAELSTRKSTSAWRMRVENWNSRYSLMPAAPGGT